MQTCSTTMATTVITIFMELTAQKGKGDRGKRTNDRARTRDLRSTAEFQPRKPRRPIEILRPPSLLCTGHSYHTHTITAHIHNIQYKTSRIHHIYCITSTFEKHNFFRLLSLQDVSRKRLTDQVVYMIST